VKLHRQGPELLVAAADADLLGQTFRGGGLHLTVSKGFYAGDEGGPEILVERLKLATIANLVGRKTVEAAIAAGFVDPACVLEIGGVPHAQMAKL